MLGSLTAGEMAFSAMSTICKIPNSMSCSKVLDGPRSTVSSNSAMASRRQPIPSVHHEQRRSGWHELANSPEKVDLDVVMLGQLGQAGDVNEANIARSIT